MLRWTASFARRAARRAKAAGDWRLAASEYARALRRDPGHAGSWVQYGNALRESGKPVEAEAAYRRALELDERNPDAHVQFAHLLKETGRFEAAVDAYLRALSLDPLLLHVSVELIQLGWTAHVPPPEATRAAPANVSELVLDASDLLEHFRHARLPTGIQRVQLHVNAALLQEPRRPADPAIACFIAARNLWVRVPDDLFLRLVDLALRGGPADDPGWRRLVFELLAVQLHGDPIRFADRARLINLGSSWSLPNYLLKIRDAKARHRIRYIPFVHDCIPVLRPQFCKAEIVPPYLNWLVGVFFHADAYLVNSRSTSADLCRAAEVLGHRIPAPHVVRLDGDFRGREAAAAANRRGAPLRALRGRPFVLFVATFEPRKNHLLAFEAWLSLLRRRGSRRTPLLVCVGHRGWMVEPAMALLRSNKGLRRRVRIFYEIADGDLAELYRRCLFTIYPSAYEGWGLPVTESLCFGKVPLISRAASLPEAGGDLAEYVDLDRPDDLAAKAERLIDDEAYRAAKEAAIRTGFRPRGWEEIAAQILAAAAAIPLGDDAAPAAPFAAETGRYYPVALNAATSLSPGLLGGEMYRTGDGWSFPESWGCWLEGNAADLAFTPPATDADAPGLLLYLGLRGVPREPVGFEVHRLGAGLLASGSLEPDERRWVRIRLPPPADGPERSVRLRLTSDGKGEIAPLGNGTHRRHVTLGVLGFYLCREDDPHGLPPEIAALCPPVDPVEEIPSRPAPALGGLVKPPPAP